MLFSSPSPCPSPSPPFSVVSWYCSVFASHLYAQGPLCQPPGCGGGGGSSQTKSANYRQVIAVALVSPSCLELPALLIEVNVYLPTRPFHSNTKEKAEATQTMSGYAGRTSVFSRGHPELSNLLRDFFFFALSFLSVQ